MVQDLDEHYWQDTKEDINRIRDSHFSWEMNTWQKPVGTCVEKKVHYGVKPNTMFLAFNFLCA